MRAGAVIVAAGSGERLGAGGPKALVRVAGLPLVTWSVRALEEALEVEAIVIACPPGMERETAAAVGTHAQVHAIVPGSTSRQRSVARGLAALPGDLDAILVHDAARPLITPHVVSRLVARLAAEEAVIAAAPVPDTLKRADGQLHVEHTVDRTGLWGAQTPQAFRAPTLLGIFGDAGPEELDSATDCAGMAERRGVRVLLMDPGIPNPKVTTQADLRLVEALLGAGRIA
ncbi:MAG: 2-C-methyl-D-erythritol 4-phosphate cytidylyltransferase [Thermoleophilia bacterium]|nr:2-C-methyl-D-erythritol 4-phosphate cytidylyltransferase [Thermoleophilia bacterium]